MPSGPPPEHVQAFLRGPRPAIIGTLLADGSPSTVATWYLWLGGARLLLSAQQAARLAEPFRLPLLAGKETASRNVQSGAASLAGQRVDARPQARRQVLLPNVCLSQPPLPSEPLGRVSP